MTASMEMSKEREPKMVQFKLGLDQHRDDGTAGSTVDFLYIECD